MNSLNHVSKLLASSVVWLACTTASVQASVLDRIVAVVDSGVVLESDVERRLNDLKAQADARGNTIEISEALEEQVLERLILEQHSLRSPSAVDWKLTMHGSTKRSLRLPKTEIPTYWAYDHPLRLKGKASLCFASKFVENC